MSINWNEICEKIAEAAISKTPYVGGLLASVVPMFWPSSGPSLWDQIKADVEKMVEQDIAANNLANKKLQLQGIKDELQTYVTLTDKKQKQIALENIDMNIVSGIPTFMSGDPGKGFSCFWGMAMLHISVRREMVDVFGISGNQTLLEQSLAIYSLFGATAQMVMFNERMDNVSFSCASNNVPGKNSQWEVSADLNDSLTGALFQFAHRYINASPSDITAGIQQCDNGVPLSWNRLGDSVKAQENEWAGKIIQSFSQNCTIPSANRPALLSKYMGSDLYSTYTTKYANQGYVVPPVQPWQNWYNPTEDQFHKA